MTEKTLNEQKQHIQHDVYLTEDYELKPLHPEKAEYINTNLPDPPEPEEGSVTLDRDTRTKIDPDSSE